MPDVVVTVPRGEWRTWLLEGGLPGDDMPPSLEYYFHLGTVPDIQPGERVYVVAAGKLRGWAPLTRLHTDGRHAWLVRGGGAQACTLACWLGIASLPLGQVEAMGAIEAYVQGTQLASAYQPPWCQPPHLCQRYPSVYGHIRGFRGHRYRWWPRNVEVPYPDWQVL